MATNYTANYGLCQWEPEDSFIREEFNQDNAKIDAALGDLKARAGMQLIKDVELTEDAYEMSLVVDGVDWSQYAVVCVNFAPLLTVATSANITINGGSITSYSAGAYSETTRKTAQVWIMPMYLPNPVLSYHITGTGQAVQEQLYSTPLSGASFGLKMDHNNPYLMAGSKIQLWGLR